MTDSGDKTFDLSGKKIVIIATYGRSGSTLLSAIVSEAASFHMAGENGDALWGIFQSFNKLRDAKGKSHRFRTGKHEPWHLIDTVDVERYAKRLVKVFFDEVVQPPRDSKRFGFKEIRFFEHIYKTQQYLDFVTRVIPDVKFVFNTRNHQDVSKSGWYKNQDTSKVIDQLQRAETEMNKFLESHPENSILCSYDDYTQDHNALRPLFNFLEEPFDSQKVKSVLEKPLLHGKASKS